MGDFLLTCIKDASRLKAPHNFEKPRELTLTDGAVRARVTGLQDAVEQLAALNKPFLNWAGKAEHLSFDVPTLPLFVHERLSTAGIIRPCGDIENQSVSSSISSAIPGTPSATRSCAPTSTRTSG